MKELWKKSKDDPYLFFKAFVRGKKGEQIRIADVPAQKEGFDAFVSGDYDEIYIGGGNSGGKTFFLQELGVYGSVWKKYPKRNRVYKNHSEFTKDHFGVLCTGAEQKHSNELWEGILSLFKNSPTLSPLLYSVVTTSKLHPHPRIVLKNGAFIDSIGLHEKGKHVVTGDYTLILINEIGEINHLDYILKNVLTQRTWRRGGMITGAGTMRGAHTEAWTIIRRGLEVLPPDMKLNPYRRMRVFTTFADSRENPFADQERVTTFLEGNNERLIQERIMGWGVDLEGAAFSGNAINNMFTQEIPFETARNPKMDVVHGVDFGRKGDFTVCVTLDVSRKPWRGIHFYRKGGGYGTWEEIFNDLLNIYHRYGGVFVADTTSTGGDFAESWLGDLQIDYEPFNFASTPAKKINLINSLQRIIENKWLMLPEDWEALREELRIYPADMSDKAIRTDCVMALALAVYGAERYGELGQPEVFIP